MWVDRKLGRPTLLLSTLTSPVTLTLAFQGQIFKKLYLWNGRVNWYGMRETWVYKMLNPLCDLELWSWPWTSNCEQPYFKNWTADWHGTKGMSGFLEPLWPWPLTLPMTLDWIFKVKFWNDHISRMEGSIDLERKRCESGMILDPLCNLGLAIWACMWATAHTRYIGQIMGWC